MPSTHGPLGDILDPNNNRKSSLLRLYKFDSFTGFLFLEITVLSLSQ
jgi:hypothetical protein